MRKQKPCDTCTRCAQPEKCGNVDCPDWRKWFVETWDKMCEGLGGRG